MCFSKMCISHACFLLRFFVFIVTMAFSVYAEAELRWWDAQIEGCSTGINGDETTCDITPPIIDGVPATEVDSDVGSGPSINYAKYAAFCKTPTRFSPTLQADMHFSHVAITSRVSVTNLYGVYMDEAICYYNTEPPQECPEGQVGWEDPNFGWSCSDPTQPDECDDTSVYVGGQWVCQYGSSCPAGYSMGTVFHSDGSTSPSCYSPDDPPPDDSDPDDPADPADPTDPTDPADSNEPPVEDPDSGGSYEQDDGSSGNEGGYCEGEGCGDGAAYGGGTCTKTEKTPPPCTGDAIQCGVATHTWFVQCNDFLWRKELIGTDEYRNSDSLLSDSPENEISETERTFDGVIGQLDDSGYGTAQCPQDVVLDIGIGTITIPFTFICQWAEKIRPVVVALGWLTSAFIILGKLKD